MYQSAQFVPRPAYAAAPVTYTAAPTSPAVFTSVRGAPVLQAAAPVVAARQPSSSEQKAPWGGGCPWQYDKTAFKQWCKTAIEVPSSKERKELYGYLSETFLDADGDRDGLIAADEFDFLIEKAANLPRRFGLAPSWIECYGDVRHRQEERNNMFREMDKHNRGKIGMEEWMAFAIAHITEKVRTMNMEGLDFAHLERAGVEEFVKFLEVAVADRHSEQFKSLYEHLFKTFVESDRDEKGAINREQFDVLIEAAANAPRVLGLAPKAAQAYPTEAKKREVRQAEFDSMDTDKTGTITFDEFLGWALPHITEKVTEYRAKTTYTRVKQAKNETSPWGGNCMWQYDKTAFKSFVKMAVNVPTSKERKELYGFLAECFLDADGDRDGLIAPDEFDFLIENAAALPRRFGLAPSWVECYGDVQHRQAARQQMFLQMDKHQRSKIGMEEWIEFTMAHITEKARQLNMGALDFAHLEGAGQEQFVSYLEAAIGNRHSEEFKALYEHLFKTFVESDKDEKGAITIEQFDVLIEDAAQAPRALGLAPTTQQSYPTEAKKRAAREAEFAAMDFDRTGVVTFDKFLGWALDHIARKVSSYRASRR